MRFRIATLPIILALSASGQAPAPDVAARMQAAALEYTGHLQNFTCTQILTRSAGSSPTGTHWKLLDKQESELDYVDRKEHYTLLKVNGESIDPAKRIKRGPYLTPGGEFASRLLKIFDPKAHAEFEWDHDETAGTHTCVFRYNVPQATSTEVMTADLDHVTLGHHGMVWAVCDTGAVTRFQLESDMGEILRSGRHVPLGFRTEVRYAPTAIGSQEFLLPQSASVTSLFYKTWTKVEIQYRQYRKYDANSVIKFGDGKD
jgi:hypothetical protein